MYNAQSRTWYAPLRPPVLNPYASVGQVVLNVLERTPEKVAQVNADTGTVLTCDELRRRTIRFAKFLSKSVPAREDNTVALVARNSDNTAPVVLGSFVAGITIGTLDPAFSMDEMEHMLRIMKPCAVFADREALPVARKAIERAELHLAHATLGVLQATEAELAEVPEKDLFGCFSIDTILQQATNDEDMYIPQYLGDSEQRTAAIVCSSGTTGMPKAVRISHSQLIASYQRPSQLDHRDRILCFSTMYWISGLQMLLTGVFGGIQRIITSYPGTAQKAVELCQRFAVTILFVTPALAADIARMLEACGTRLSYLKLFAMGGCAVPPSLRNDITKHVLLPGHGLWVVGYGASETGPITYNRNARDDAVGSLLPGITAKIVNDHNQLLGPNEPGELLVRTVHPFLGYHGDATATAQVIDEDGFIRTGDIGRFDSDGFLYLVDRKKEIFKYDGYQVTPAELEAVIGDIPGVKQVVVVGVPDLVNNFNSLATALIVREDGYGDEILSQKLVAEHVQQRISSTHKQLRGGVIFVDQLPMTLNGKVKRCQAKIIAIEKFRILSNMGKPANE